MNLESELKEELRRVDPPSGFSKRVMRSVEDRRSRLSGQARLPVLHTTTAPQAIPQSIPNIALVTASTTSLTPSSSAQVGESTGREGGSGTDTVGDDANGPLVAGTGGVTSPVAIHRVDPVFPQSMLRGRMGGWVVLQCVIDKTGHIRDVSVVHSSFGAFEQPAIDAVQQWLFTPGTLRGQPVDVIFELTVKFQVR